MKTVLISGANGFIATHIGQKLKNSGLRTVGISRSSQSIPYFDAVYKGSLMRPLEEIFEKEEIHTFIHCANHVGTNDYEINVEGTRLWAEQAKQKGVHLQIFLSSTSAREGSASSYGRAKFELERWFTSNDQIVLRLGLVVGNGGVFRNMVFLVKKYPVMPFPDKGRAKVYLTGIDFLCDVIRDIVQIGEPIPGAALWNLFQPDPVTVREVLKEIKRQYKTLCAFLSIPSGLILSMVRILEHLPFLKLNVSSNNIIGLRQDKGFDFKSDFARFGYPESSLSELIQKTVNRKT